MNKTKKKRKNKTNPIKVPKQSLTNRVGYYYRYFKLPDQKITKKRLRYYYYIVKATRAEDKTERTGKVQRSEIFANSRSHLVIGLERGT